MKTKYSVSGMLAGVGTLSLLLYVLACATSFSPDDRQVLYPTIDPRSGAMGVAVYDRRSGQSETIFTAAAAATNQVPQLMRATWLPDGKHILIASAPEDRGLNLLVLPHGVRDPARQFALPKSGSDTDKHSAAVSLELPFAVQGAQVYLNGESRTPMRVNLVTGETAGGDSATNDLFVLPSPDGRTLLGLRDSKNGDGMEYGTLDSATLKFKPAGLIGTNLAEGTLPAFNAANGQLLWLKKTGDQLELQIRQPGQPDRTRPLTRPGEKLEVGPCLEVTPNGKEAVTVYGAVSAATTKVEYGLLEIPLGEAPLRFTPLFHGTNTDDAELMFAQPSLSHDGKTWALGTACLYLQNESLGPESCALFLVDLSRPGRPVTKVPIPVPPQRKPLVH